MAESGVSYGGFEASSSQNKCNPDNDDDYMATASVGSTGNPQDNDGDKSSSEQNILGGNFTQEPITHHSDHGDNDASLNQGQTARQDTTQRQDDAWDPRNLLTFDGGGMRGYWSLLVLERLMEAIARQEESVDPKGVYRDRTMAHHSFFPADYPKNVTHLPLVPEEEERARDDPSGHPSYLSQAKRFLPCHYFDYIGGSSTGALIAIMLGRLRMTVPDCKDEYRRLGSEVFGRPRLRCTLRLPLSKRSKYDAERLERVFENVASRRRETPGGRVDHQQQSAALELPSRDHLCHTFVTTLAAMEPAVTKLHLLRSYDCLRRRPSTRALARGSGYRQNTLSHINGAPEKPPAPPPDRKINYGKADRMRIPVVARAATAALGYFDPVSQDLGDDRKMIFEDAGFGSTNNPTRTGVEEIQDMHGEYRVGAIVSIGTARSNLAYDGEQNALKRIRDIFKRAIDTATSPEIVHNEMRARFSDDQYYRLNPESDDCLLNIQLDEWRPKKSSSRKYPSSSKSKDTIAGSETVREMENQFYKYYARQEVREQLEGCARLLVACRRNRTKDHARWERYALGSSFKCCFHPEDEDCTKVISLRPEFEAHLKKTHKLVEKKDIISAVDRSETLFRYPEAKQQT